MDATILLADQVLTAGANQCSNWKGFAKRGLGVSAIQGIQIGSLAGGTRTFVVCH